MPLQTLHEVMRQARGIRHEQTRRESEEYLEMVMFRDSWDDVASIFQEYFGAPLKPAGEEPGDEAQDVSGPYGGITKEQTLYHAQRGEECHVAMIWPWVDGRRMTVKILQECP